MDKESVLQKSREENKNGDEYVIQKKKSCRAQFASHRFSRVFAFVHL